MAAAKLDKMEKTDEIVSNTKASEAIYTATELSNNCQKLFGTNVRKECVLAALRIKGKKSASVSDAKKMVMEFLKKEVR